MRHILNILLFMQHASFISIFLFYPDTTNLLYFIETILISLIGAIGIIQLQPKLDIDLDNEIIKVRPHNKYVIFGFLFLYVMVSLYVNFPINLILILGYSVIGFSAFGYQLLLSPFWYILGYNIYEVYTINGTYTLITRRNKKKIKDIKEIKARQINNTTYFEL